MRKQKECRPIISFNDRAAFFSFINNVPFYFLVVTVLAADHAE